MKKTEKGITLIALIITIVVLLILAVVAISGVQESDIIMHANNAVEEHERAKDNEIDVLASYEQLIDENNPNVKKINDERICQILTNWMNGRIENDGASTQLKVEIPTIQENNVYDMLILIESDTYYVYIYEIERLYKFDMDANTFVYAEKEENAEQYDFGENVKKVETELERIFVGKTVSEISEKYNAGTLDDYVIEKSNNKIIDISFGLFNQDALKVASITFKDGENEITISEDGNNYSNWILCKDEIFYNVEISWGT